MKRMIKLSAVVVACFVTWLATSSIIAQQRGKPKPPAGKKVVQKIADPLPDSLAVAKASPGMANLKNYNVTVADGKATVSLNAVLVDHRPGISYIWRLKVIDATKNPLADLWYDQQTFRLDETGIMEPSFHEVFDLPAGAKTVSVALYEVRDGVDLLEFKQSAPKDKSGAIVLRGVAQVNP